MGKSKDTKGKPQGHQGHSGRGWERPGKGAGACGRGSEGCPKGVWTWIGVLGPQKAPETRVLINPQFLLEIIPSRRASQHSFLPVSSQQLPPTSTHVTSVSACDLLCHPSDPAHATSYLGALPAASWPSAPIAIALHTVSH